MFTRRSSVEINVLYYVKDQDTANYPHCQDIIRSSEVEISLPNETELVELLTV